MSKPVSSSLDTTPPYQFLQRATGFTTLAIAAIAITVIGLNAHSSGGMYAFVTQQGLPLIATLGVVGGINLLTFAVVSCLRRKAIEPTIALAEKEYIPLPTEDNVGEEALPEANEATAPEGQQPVTVPAEEVISKKPESLSKQQIVQALKPLLGSVKNFLAVLIRAECLHNKTKKEQTLLKSLDSAFTELEKALLTQLSNAEFIFSYILEPCATIKDVDPLVRQMIVARNANDKDLEDILTNKYQTADVHNKLGWNKGESPVNTLVSHLFITYPKDNLFLKECLRELLEILFMAERTPEACAYYETPEGKKEKEELKKRVDAITNGYEIKELIQKQLKSFLKNPKNAQRIQELTQKFIHNGFISNVTSLIQSMFQMIHGNQYLNKMLLENRNPQKRDIDLATAQSEAHQITDLRKPENALVNAVLQAQNADKSITFLLVPADTDYQYLMENDLVVAACFKGKESKIEAYKDIKPPSNIKTPEGSKLIAVPYTPDTSHPALKLPDILSAVRMPGAGFLTKLVSPITLILKQIPEEMKSLGDPVLRPFLEGCYNVIDSALLKEKNPFREVFTAASLKLMDSFDQKACQQIQELENAPHDTALSTLTGFLDQLTKELEASLLPNKR